MVATWITGEGGGGERGSIALAGLEDVLMSQLSNYSDAAAAAAVDG